MNQQKTERVFVGRAMMQIELEFMGFKRDFIEKMLKDSWDTVEGFEFDIGKSFVALG
jgi:hypothetical protein